MTDEESLRKELTEFVRAYYEPARQLILKRLDVEGYEAMLRDEVDKLMPYLRALRERSGVSGAVTQEEFHQISMKSSFDRVEDAQAKIARASQMTEDSARRELLTRLAENVKADLSDLQLLHHADVTEEKLREVTERITGRMNDLTPRMRKGD